VTQYGDLGGVVNLMGKITSAFLLHDIMLLQWLRVVIM